MLVGIKIIKLFINLIVKTIEHTKPSRTFSLTILILFKIHYNINPKVSTSIRSSSMVKN